MAFAFVPFSLSGAKPLDLAGKHFAIDWRNYPRQPEFVDVEEKYLVWVTCTCFMKTSKHLRVFYTFCVTGRQKSVIEVEEMQRKG